LHAEKENYTLFESQFYGNFDNFQITKDIKQTLKYDSEKTVVGELVLQNNQFFPFKYSLEANDTDFIYNMFRKFENFDVIHDKF
jgi:hypothetical protein